jgi:hypothetical protein
MVGGILDAVDLQLVPVPDDGIVTPKDRALAWLGALFSGAPPWRTIHYSCESFYEKQGTETTRSVSIASKNGLNGNITSFGVHLVAEERGIRDFATLMGEYEVFEREMLASFYEHVRKHKQHSWLHWNMRDVKYGFAALEHRCRVLGGIPVDTDELRTINLAELLPDVYGRDYVTHKRLENLMKLNGITDLDFLTGQAEALAFEAGELNLMHQSTIRKVEVISTIANRAWQGDLKTNPPIQCCLGDH